MSGLSTLKLPEVPELFVELVPPDTIRLRGAIALRDPGPDLGAFFRRVHATIVEQGLPRAQVDVSKLSFVNSSSIRLFVDWAGWVRAGPAAARYQLRFLTSRQITWQRMAFAALVSLAREVVEVEPVD